jgi:DNA mismatch endonuclease, patch repair protein
MTDVHTKEKRSRNMAAIRGNRNESTEMTLVKVFRSKKIKGWKRNNKKVSGKPDFVFAKQRLAVFVDGCFWHGCPKHFIVPKTKRFFWKNKITRNKERDKEVNFILKKSDWKVLRIWEHEIKKNPEKSLQKVVASLTSV